ncbi:MAG: hypothetical protein LBT86_09045 [Deltaproteobacteria bacterium]|jgi:hypothetical protein|nr:hypothetical protein [Deltaproteobacteria bacterium]
MSSPHLKAKPYAKVSLKPSPQAKDPRPAPPPADLTPPEIELANHEARQKRLVVAKAY